jgi:hypothetical protein
MAGISAICVVRPLHPLSPHCLHVQTVGGTLQLFAQAYDIKGIPISPGFNWSSDNTSVATVNSSGLVTGVANGICNIQAQAADAGLASASTPLGVALLSANSISLAYGNSSTLSSIGGFPTANWCGGCPGACEVVAGTIVNGFVVRQTRVWEGIPDQPARSLRRSTPAPSAPRRRLTFQSSQTSAEFTAWRLPI